MTPQQIQAAYERANNVLNGFVRPNQQNARDVVNLLKHFNSLKTAEKPKQDYDMPDFLKELFK